MNTKQGGVTSRRQFLATVLALPAAMTQCSPEPVVPSVPVAAPKTTIEYVDVKSVCLKTGRLCIVRIWEKDGVVMATDDEGRTAPIPV